MTRNLDWCLVLVQVMDLPLGKLCQSVLRFDQVVLGERWEGGGWSFQGSGLNNAGLLGFKIREHRAFSRGSKASSKLTQP